MLFLIAIFATLHQLIDDVSCIIVITKFKRNFRLCNKDIGNF